MNAVNSQNFPDSIPLSALQHFAFCPRQCALIHVEQVWAENAQTTGGKQNHERGHAGGLETRGGVKTLRALPLLSRQYGIAGVADVVELLLDGSPRPVEYKSGKAKLRLADEVQLCAQGLCLEEMFGVHIPGGFIYHVASHKRREVAFTAKLRGAVQNVIEGVRELLSSQMLPPPAADERCRLCSLFESCEPFVPRELPRGYDPFDTRMPQ